MLKKISAFIIVFLIAFPSLALAYSDGLYINSFYAISSYIDRNYGNMSDQVALSWSEIRSKNGNIFFTQKRYEEGVQGVQYDYGVPMGSTEVINLVREMKVNGAKLKLSVFLNKKEIMEKMLLSEDIQNKIINEMTADLKVKYFDYGTKINGEYVSGYITEDSGNYIEYDGLIIDFEGLAPSLKDKFNTFINKLRERLPKDKTLTLCLPPKMGNADKGETVKYYYGYDYAHLGAVADEIILMAHDYEYASANSQYRIPASAPYKLVEDAIINAKKDIPAYKILLNISINNIQWRKGETAYHTPYYSAVVNAIEGNNANEKVIEVTNQELRYDEYQRVGYAFLKREVIYSGIVYTFEDEFYYENGRSIEEKVNLAKRYGLKGVSIWRLGAANSNDGGKNFSPELFDPIFKYRMFDINSDGKINNQDLDSAMLSYGSKPGDNNWRKELDFDNNGMINIYDIARMTKYMNLN